MDFERDSVTALLQKLVDGTATPSQQDYLLIALDCYTEEEIWEMLEELDYVSSREHDGQQWISSPEELENCKQELLRRIARQAPKDTPHS